MSVIYLDTYVAMFLPAGAVEELSADAKRQIELHGVLITPMVLLGLEYLSERESERQRSPDFEKQKP